jgi:oxygen-independent coproporphyrinogen-3 oxidase
MAGERCRKLCRTKAEGLTDKVTADRALQHIVKMAFYRAATQMLGGEPPWGALTGVRPVKLPTRAMEEGAGPAQA